MQRRKFKDETKVFRVEETSETGEKAEEVAGGKAEKDSTRYEKVEFYAENWR